jgi:hypothetical protein
LERRIVPFRRGSLFLFQLIVQFHCATGRAVRNSELKKKIALKRGLKNFSYKRKEECSIEREM